MERPAEALTGLQLTDAVGVVELVPEDRGHYTRARGHQRSMRRTGTTMMNSARTLPVEPRMGSMVNEENVLRCKLAQGVVVFADSLQSAANKVCSKLMQLRPATQDDSTSARTLQSAQGKLQHMHRSDIARGD